LCENTWNGGAGYTLEEVGRMTLDQVWFTLTDLKIFKGQAGGRTQKMKPAEAVAAAKVHEDGTVAGRTADGSAIRGVIRGKSLARELMEKQQAEIERKNRKRRRRGKR